ncbi:MAG TPA: ABC transporter ATP-binding protein [Acidimicrobiia bacterium]|nr:ABC transporter ATP-binding protein [Acidimicrobiia bacterium]
MDAIVAEGLRKRYRKTVALDGLSFAFPAGRVSGFLGPNGAGKTTTFRSLLGLTKPDAGSMEVLGMSVRDRLPEVVKRLGAIVEEPGLVKGLSGRDNLVVAANTLGRGRERVDDLLEFSGLGSEGGRRIDGYSKGMRQRLALAASLLGDPELLILDEPLDGLDPAGQAQIKDSLRQLAGQGKTVIVSSHNLSDIEAMADHVVVINKGRLLAAGDLASLLGSFRSGYTVEVDEPERAAAVLSEAGIVAVVEDDLLAVSTDDGAAVARALAMAEIFPREIARRSGRLEELFLSLTESDR